MQPLKKRATLLVVPGLRDHVDAHWQTHLQRRQSALRPVRCVPPLEADRLSRAAQVAALQRSLEAIDGPVLLVAHSAGVITVAHWARKHARPIAGALLVAPPDFESPLPDGYPTPDALQANEWLPVPRAALPFRSLVAASSNDPLARLDRVRQMAEAWGSEWIEVGALGHINPAAGFGAWPMADQLIHSLDN